MSQTANGNYVVVDGFNLWWSPKTPHEVHLVTSDPSFEHPDTGPGLQVTFSANPDSANYHPQNFNRCATLLRKHGKPAPDELAVEGPRRLDKRGWRKVGRLAAPTSTYTVCPACDGPLTLTSIGDDVPAWSCAMSRKTCGATWFDRGDGRLIVAPLA